MSLATPSNIRELQIKLYRKAKNEPGYRFYMLYDKVYREDILAHAYARARAHKGGAGGGEPTFAGGESAGGGTRGAQDSVQEVHELLCEGYTDVVDADLSKYFDTIPHSELLQCVARRIVDKHMLHLIKMWLKVPVEEKDEA